MWHGGSWRTNGYHSYMSVSRCVFPLSARRSLAKKEKEKKPRPASKSTGPKAKTKIKKKRLARGQGNDLWMGSTWVEADPHRKRDLEAKHIRQQYPPLHHARHSLRRGIVPRNMRHVLGIRFGCLERANYLITSRLCAFRGRG